ncbi:MAG TPA: Wzz/FepE/Etk N-terminal domain-containing protein, partial [Bacteroidales bacterium]|nr:Wzz/FepE/Etk N-terminal domain-containing protein [Bacteroidales bacterium]
METQFNNPNIKQEESIDLKALFFKFFRYWYFFALTIFVALVIAFLFNKYTKPVFQVKTTVLIKDDRSSPDLLGFGINS